MMVKTPQPGEGGGSTSCPFNSMYHHEQSCGVRSSWEVRYSTLLLFLQNPYMYSVADTHTHTPHTITHTHTMIHIMIIWEPLTTSLRSCPCFQYGGITGQAGRQADTLVRQAVRKAGRQTGRQKRTGHWTKIQIPASEVLNYSKQTCTLMSQITI